jgi:hypothetical protein
MAARPTSGIQDLVAEPDLRPGDVVLHEDHGVGVLRDLKTVEIDGVARDTLQLDYHGGASLLAPIEEIGRIWRYGAEAGAVTLDRLKGDGWAQAPGRGQPPCRRGRRATGRPGQGAREPAAASRSRRPRPPTPSSPRASPIPRPPTSPPPSGGAGGPRLGASDGPVGVRRRRFRQDRGRASRRRRRGAERTPGGAGRADHGPGSTACRDLQAPVLGDGRRRGPSVAPGHARPRPGPSSKAWKAARSASSSAPRRWAARTWPSTIWADDHRRGAEVRRGAEGPAARPGRRRPSADPDGHADPPHLAGGHGRHPGCQRDRQPARAPPTDPHLPGPLRRGQPAHRPAAREAARRPELLRRSAYRGHRAAGRSLADLSRSCRCASPMAACRPTRPTR